MIISLLTTLTLISYFTNLPLAFLFINILTRHQRIYNMRFMSLIGFMIFHRFYAAKGGTKPKMVIFLGRNIL
jgi:ABC-type uncharacterized transport system permease subunit